VDALRRLALARTDAGDPLAPVGDELLQLLVAFFVGAPKRVPQIRLLPTVVGARVRAARVRVQELVAPVTAVADAIADAPVR
jgi:hypothetical protein